MRENGVDSPYFILHPSFSFVASLAHPEGGGGMLKRGVYIHVDFCISLRTIPVNPT